VSRAKPAYASILKSGNVAITTAQERKKQQIICVSSYRRIPLEQ